MPVLKYATQFQSQFSVTTKEYLSLTYTGGVALVANSAFPANCWVYREGNMVFSPATGFVFLRAGKTYRLTMVLPFTSAAGGDYCYSEFWNTTLGLKIPSSGTAYMFPNNNNSNTHSPTNMINCLYTPAADCNVFCKAISVSGSIYPAQGTWTVEEILSSNSGNLLVPNSMVTKTQRLALTATEGLEVYQTDNGPGKYVYTNGQWEQTSGLQTAHAMLAAGLNSLNTGSDIAFDRKTGTLPMPSSGLFQLLAGKTYELSCRLSCSFGAASSVLTYGWVDGANTALPIANVQNVTVLPTSWTGNLSFIDDARGVWTPSVDTQVKVRILYAGGATTVYGGNASGNSNSFASIKQLR